MFLIMFDRVFNLVLKKFFGSNVKTYQNLIRNMNPTRTLHVLIKCNYVLIKLVLTHIIHLINWLYSCQSV